MCFMLLILYLFFFFLSRRKISKPIIYFYSIIFSCLSSIEFSNSQKIFILLLRISIRRKTICYNKFNGKSRTSNWDRKFNKEFHFQISNFIKIFINNWTIGALLSYFFLCPSVFVAKSISIQIVVVLNLMTRFKEKYNNGIKQGNEKTTSYFIFLFFFFSRFRNAAGSISSQITITSSP